MYVSFIKEGLCSEINQTNTIVQIPDVRILKLLLLCYCERTLDLAYTETSQSKGEIPISSEIYAFRNILEFHV